MGVFTDFMDKNEDKMSDADDYMVENDEEYDLVKFANRIFGRFFQ